MKREYVSCLEDRARVLPELGASNAGHGADAVTRAAHKAHASQTHFINQNLTNQHLIFAKLVSWRDNGRVPKTPVFGTQLLTGINLRRVKLAIIPKTRPKIKVSKIDKFNGFWYNYRDMASTEQKRKLLKAKIAVALQDELGRVPKEEEVNQVFLLTRVMYKAVLGLHFKRQEQKKNGQLAIF